MNNLDNKKYDITFICLNKPGIIRYLKKKIKIITIKKNRTFFSFFELRNIIWQNYDLDKEYKKVIKEVRGTGLLLGLQLKVNQTKFIEKLMKEKLLTIRAGENVVRILPPLNVSKKEIDQAVTIINKVCKSYK